MDERMVRKVLRRAAELVRQGWCQGTFATDGMRHLDWNDTAAERFCLAGALHRAMAEVTGTSGDNDVIDILRDLPHDGASAIAYNDAPGRTAEEVAALLERAAGEP